MQKLPNITTHFSDWYNDVIYQAELVDQTPVRGSVAIRPYGWAIWEEIKSILDKRIKETGHQNASFPLLIPESFLKKEAEHVEGFAPQCAVVTHGGGKELEEPLVIRPTSETIIWSMFRKWIMSYRDLPMKINQWANVVRWEMRTRLFLRTSEFLWQEGHTAHASREDALKSTLEALEMYREFSETVLAVPVIAGEKPENERFPGADATYSIEAMMQDGKALQAGTSHYLGTSFARAQNIRFQGDSGELEFCHTSSWGTSPRLIGGLIMTHGDDDGLRLPPAVAPRQVVVVPMLRGKPEDAEVMAYGQALVKDLEQQFALGEPIRALLDVKDQKSADKRWNWVRRGAPILLAQIQQALFDEAKARLDANIVSDLTTFDQVADHFGQVSDEDEVASPFRGWVRASWSRPSGDELEAVVQKLKAFKLTLRNAPMDQPSTFGPCIFTGAPGVEEILIGRAY